MLHEISLENEARELEAMAEMLENIEEGLGADGVGHGKLRPPRELDGNGADTGLAL